MKLCKYCNKYFPDSDFGVALTVENKIYRRNKCRFCYRKTKKELQKKYREFVYEYKKKGKCQMCGISDHRVLDFHHADGESEEKEFNLGDITSRGYGLKKIKKEIEKCVLICANCHRISHFNKNSKTT